MSKIYMYFGSLEFLFASWWQGDTNHDLSVVLMGGDMDS